MPSLVAGRPLNITTSKGVVLKYSPIYMSRDSYREKYLGWEVLHQEQHLKTLRKTFGPTHRLLILANGASEEQISRQLVFCDGLTCEIILHDFAAPPRDMRLIDGRAFDIVQSSAERLLNVQTVVIDLTKSVESLWSEMEAKTRNVCRSRARAGAQIEFHGMPDDDLVTAYCGMYGRMARARKLHVPSRAVIHSMFNSGDLTMALSRDVYGETTTINLVYTSGRDALFFYGANKPSSMTGAQYLHWETIKHLKDRGFLHYDLGGLPADVDQGIARFKRSLGGTVTSLGREYVWRPRVVQLVWGTVQRVASLRHLSAR